MPEPAASVSDHPPKEAAAAAATAATPAAAAGADAAEPAAAAKQQQQQQQQQQQKEKGRRVRFQKNDPNTFTFKLLPAAQQQLRQHAAAAAEGHRPRMQLQRVIPPNARNKPQQPLPDYLQQQLEELDIGEETDIRTKYPGKYKEPDLLPRVEEAPSDAAAVATPGAAAAAADAAPAAAAAAAAAAEAAAAAMCLLSAASQVLAAMEACEGYEEIADDFVATALVDEDGEEWGEGSKLLWGCRQLLLPVSPQLAAAAGDSWLEETAKGDRKETPKGDRKETQEMLLASDAEDEETDSHSKTLGQRLEQVLEEYRDECIGELDREEYEESDSFSDYEECFDDFLKSQEPAETVKRGPRCLRRRSSCCSDSSDSSDSSSGSSTSSSSSSSSSKMKRKDGGFRLCEIDDELKEKTLALARLQEDEEDKPSTVHVPPVLPPRARPTWSAEGTGRR
ncbi:hypothetical protein, conserved [Eimeria brunetti]|uniref:Uncharacterized protein n=1 Tax=Eimeria brunetti TaxID=51314 RepID=U6LND5_9EIME|nr:hypothetical protein, conserved [Eimeria brunetti]